MTHKYGWGNKAIQQEELSQQTMLEQLDKCMERNETWPMHHFNTGY